jgi:hypothetical protein
MDIIKLPRLRISELQALTASALTICEPLAEIEEQRQTVETEFANFKEGVLKNHVSAEVKTTLDKERDRYNSGFCYELKAEFSYPYTDGNAIETINKLKALYKKYGFKINRLRMNEETAALDNCMKEAEGIDLTPLTNQAIARWIPLIKDANQRFKKVADDIIEENAIAAQMESASSVAPGLTNALESLFVQIFSAIHIAPSDALKKAYTELETLADSYR